MSMRTTSRTVVFARPFSLTGIAGPLPAGAYEIKTDEESIDSVSFLAYRRIATLLSVSHRGETQWHSIEPTELDAALFIDARAASRHRVAAIAGATTSERRAGIRLVAGRGAEGGGVTERDEAPAPLVPQGEP